MGKYKGLLDDLHAKQAGELPVEEIAAHPSPALPVATPSEPMNRAAAKRKTGRPKSGKSSNPEFVQVTAYVEETVHLSVKKALVGVKNTDFSDLVNDLLKKWVKSRT
jgi:hypothetical protein